MVRKRAPRWCEYGESVRSFSRFAIGVICGDMAGEIASAPDEPVAAPVAAPEAIAPAPVAEVAAPVAEVPVVVAEAAPAAETLIEGAADPAAEVVAEAAKPDAEKPAEAIETPLEVAPLAYEAFKLPEGFTPADDQIKAFTDLIGTHQLPQDKAQALIDLHTGEMKKFADRETQRQQDVWVETNRNWQAEAAKEFGNRYDTTLNEAKSFISRIVPDAKKRGALFQVLAATGAGNHPAIIGLMAAAEKKMSERGAPAPSVPRKGNGGQPWDNRYSGQGS
jgi:hypothetical protein